MTIERTVRCFAFACMFTATTASAQAAAPASAKQQDWISLQGTVVSTQPESFRLDYGKGIITVEVPDWNWLQEGRKLIGDHRVTVYGRVDNATREQRRLVAAGLYDRDLGTYYDISHENHGLWTMTDPLSPGHVEVAGRVLSVAGRELVLDSGTRVDTRKLAYDPLDDKGYPQIGPGDMIKASGYLAKDIWEGTEVVAAWIIEMHRQEAP